MKPVLLDMSNYTVEQNAESGGSPARYNFIEKGPLAYKGFCILHCKLQRFRVAEIAFCEYERLDEGNCRSFDRFGFEIAKGEPDASLASRDFGGGVLPAGCPRCATRPW